MLEYAGCSACTYSHRHSVATFLSIALEEAIEAIEANEAIEAVDTIYAALWWVLHRPRFTQTINCFKCFNFNCFQCSSSLNCFNCFNLLQVLSLLSGERSNCGKHGNWTKQEAIDATRATGAIESITAIQESEAMLVCSGKATPPYVRIALIA